MRLDHVKDGANCGGTPFFCWGSVGTDGCDGEMMCSSFGQPCSAPSSATYTYYEGWGARRWYTTNNGRFGERDVGSGSSSGADITSHRKHSLSRVSIFKPRIDCAGLSSPTYECVAAIPEITGSSPETNDSYTRIIAMKDYTDTGGWAYQISKVNDHMDIAYQPDVAMNPQGTKAFAVLVAEHDLAVWIKAYDLTTATFLGGIQVGFDASGPARIVYDRVGPYESESWVRVIWQERNGSTQVRSFKPDSPFTTIVSGANSAGHLFNGIRRDVPWDFACGYNTPRESRECVLFGIEMGGDRVRSQRWAFSADATTLQHGAFGFQGGFTNGYTLLTGVESATFDLHRWDYVVSAGRKTASESTANTRMLRFDTSDVGQTYSTALTLSDAFTCDTQSHNGIANAPMSMSGGYSAAYSVHTGRLFSLHYSGGPSVFCY